MSQIPPAPYSLVAKIVSKKLNRKTKNGIIYKICVLIRFQLTPMTFNCGCA